MFSNIYFLCSQIDHRIGELQVMFCIDDDLNVCIFLKKCAVCLSAMYLSVLELYVGWKKQNDC